MTLQLDPSFDSDYDVELLIDMPSALDYDLHEPDMAPKSDLLRLPLLGLTCLVVNRLLGMWLHPRERLLARLLWIGGVIVQLVLLMGVLRLVA